jgi:hypothetical protein
MAKSTHIFFNATKDLAEVSEELGKLMCLSFQRSQEDSSAFVAAGCMMDVMLRNDHDFENDRGIPFERFQFWLCFDCLYRNNVHPHDEHMRQATARLAYQLIIDRLGYPAMLVEDLQKLVSIHKLPIPVN